jgi:osmotically-inducible protein OsmY
MITTKLLRKLIFAVVLACALPACATYRKCGLAGCPGDAAITAQVQALFEQHAELGGPNTIGIQTLDHVVYLTGFVDTDVERDIAEAVAGSAPGAVRVVNSIAVRSTVH